MLAETRPIPEEYREPVRHARMLHNQCLFRDSMMTIRVLQVGLGPIGLEAYLGAPESFDSVLIDGSPRIYSKVHGGT